MNSVYRTYLKSAAIIWGLCLAVFVLVFVFILMPQEKLRETTEQQYNEIKSEADTALIVSQESQIAKLNKQIEDMNNRINDFLFTPVEVANLTFDISRISQNIGLGGFGISGTGSERMLLYDNCKYLFARSIPVSFNAGFNEFAAFVNALEKHRPVIFINTFSINRSQQTNGENKVDMELVVLVAKDQKA
jgi:Tfp pilus assembly protein PilO